MAAPDGRWSQALRALGWNILAAAFLCASPSGCEPDSPLRTADARPGEVLPLDLKLPHESAQLIVGIRPGTDISSVIPADQIRSVVRLRSLNMLIVTITDVRDQALQSIAEKIAAAENVSFVQLNHKLQLNTWMEPGDPKRTEQWALERIQAPAAWALIPEGARPVVAVIDTGISTEHPDLSARLWHNPCEACDNGADDSCSDGRTNGLVDDGHGWNFVDDNSDLADGSEHGTFVSGVIGAIHRNQVCIAGVAPDVSLMTLKALPPNRAEVSESHIIGALDYAISGKAEVINASWSLELSSIALREAFESVTREDIVIAAASGAEDFPCQYGLSNVICVGATSEQNDDPIDDNWDREKVHLGAPGADIYSTIPDASGINCTTRSHSSTAAPHVAGVAALILARCPQASAEEVVRRIVQCADPVSSLSYKTISGGRLNALHALEGTCGVVSASCTLPYQPIGSAPK